MCIYIYTFFITLLLRADIITDKTSEPPATGISCQETALHQLSLWTCDFRVTWVTSAGS